MVAIFTGLGAGFERGSGAALGSVGLLGNGAQGRGGDNVSVNAATGNLLINRRDEFLVGRGPDVGISRTYNSHGYTDGDDNNDRWRQSTDRRLRNSTGTLNTNGATVTRVSGDGSEIVYTYHHTYKGLDINGNIVTGSYRATDGSGAHDSIVFANNKWTWSDGDTDVRENYYGTGTYIQEQVDRDGNTVSFTYSSGKLSKIETDGGGYLKYTWSGNNITSIETYASGGTTKTLTRTRYSYDASNRLIKVTTDLTPENNVAVTTGSGANLEGVENESYVTSYTYVGSTNLVETVTQTDGSELRMTYDGQWRVTSIRQKVADGEFRLTKIGYGLNTASVTDPSGGVTTLWYDNKGQLIQIQAPVPEPGGDALVVQIEYDSSGNVLRTINTTAQAGTIAGNLIENADWGGGEFARHGANLVDDGGWPQDVDTVPTGPATVDGWITSTAFSNDTSWTSTNGPYGDQVVSMHAGQLNTGDAGGGGLSNNFEIDGSKSYEFTYYFKADELNKHQVYFGLRNGGNLVKNGHDNTVNNNPYFTYDYPNAASGIEVGKWYKVVGYVLPEDAETSAVGSFGGVYDTETGDKVRDVKHFRWNEGRADNSAYSRFFNYYNTNNQGQFTHFYKPEVREVIGGGHLTDNAALDVERDAALLLKPAVDGWINNNSYVGRQEARWAEVDGPNGSSIVALETGQFDSASVGGGNWTNEFTIDPTKNYKFTQYVRKSDLTKHNIYFGLSASSAGNEYVKYAHTGNATTNPYFMSLSTTYQPTYLDENKWYKVVGYVLAEGSANVTHGTLGGIFDAQTGTKVHSTYTYRWNETRPDNEVFARFFNYYTENQHDWTTQWGAPEVTAIDGALLTSDSANPFGIVYDESGEQASFTYDSRGNILTSTDKNGVVSYRNYDENNNLLRVRYESSRDTAVNGTHYTRYVYDSENHLRYSISAEGNVTEYTYEGASGSIYGHDGDLRSIREYTEHAYPKGGTIPTLAQMDAWRNGLASNRDNVKLFENRYDTANGNLVQTVNWASTTDIGNALSGDGYTQTYFTRDSSGQLLSHRVNGQVTTNYTYDGLGRTLTSSNLAGGTTTISFQDAATTTTITSSANLTTTSVFNKAGDLISQNEVGERVSSATSLYKYDNNGRLRMSTDATGYKNYYLYDNAGNKTADINHSGFVTEYRYDENGQLLASAAYTRYKPTAERTAMLLALADPNNNLSIEDVRYSPDPVTNHHSYDIWQWTAYDAKGQITRTALGDGSVTTYAYDKAGRLVKATSYANKLSSSILATLRSGENLENIGLPTADANKDAVVRTFYDRDGLVIGTLNGEGYLSQIIYDEAGQKIQEISFADDTNPADRASKAFSTLLASVTPSASKDISVRYVYDGQGHLRYTIDALNYVTEYVYRSGGYNTATGVVRQTIQHASPLATQSSYAYTDVRPAIDAIASNPDNRSSWALYNTRDQVIYSIDATGAVTQFQYDENGNVSRTMQYSVKRPTTSMPSMTTMNNFHNANWNTARITSNYYNSRNQLDYTVDPEGYVTTYTFDTEGRTRFENRWSNEFAFWQTNTEAAVLALNLGTAQTTQFVYDTRGLVKDVYDPNGTRTYYGRYANGTLAWEIEAFGQGDDEARTLYAYDAAGRKKWTRTYSEHYADVNSAGQRIYNTTYYYYDGVGNLTQVKETDATSTITSPDQNIYYTYDKNGQVLTQTNAEGGVTSFEYNAFGQVVKTTDPENNSSYTYYDIAGRVRLQVDAEKYVTKTTYTDFGEVYQVKRFATKATGVGNVAVDPTVNTDALDATTTFAYDKLGRLTSTTDALNFTESYSLNAYGQQETVTNKEGGVTHYTYDSRGLLIQTATVVSSYDNAATVVGRENVVQFEYDSRGNQTKKIEGYHDDEDTVNDVFIALRTTNYEYDAANRLIEKSGDAVSIYGSPTDSVASTETPTETYSYDRRGNLIESEDAIGARTLYFYDQMDRVTHQISPEGTYVRNFYDANSNLVETRVYNQTITLPADALGNPPAEPGSGYRQTTFAYDLIGQMTESKIVGILTASYDGALSVSAYDIVTAYEYDANGRVIKVTDPNGNSTYSYYDKVGNKTHQIDGEGYLTKWTYDANGNVKQERKYAQEPTGTISTSSYGTIVNNWPSGTISTAITQVHQDRVTDFTYDKNGRRTKESRQNALTYNGDGYGANHGFTIADSTVEFAYNALGQVTVKTEATDETITYTYDNHGQLTHETRSGYTDHLNESVSPKVRYSYNALGDLAQTLNHGKNLSISHSYTKYTYGAGGRLESVKDGNDQIRTYSYDVAGRVVREEYARRDHDDSTAINSNWNREATSYTYDLEGRITAQGIVVNAGATYSGGIWSGGSWSRDGIRSGTDNDTVYTYYNAFGQVEGRGLNLTVAQRADVANYKERFEYDDAGRLWRTNTGDGAFKYFMYDRNGNQTVAITSDGTNIDNKSMDQIIDLWDTRAIPDWGRLATNYVNGVNATITEYDARNMAVKVVEPERETSTTAARSDLFVTREYSAFGDVIAETGALGHNASGGIIAGHTINYTYNTMGRRIKVESPSVSVTSAANVTTSGRPTEYYFYDNSGRLRASKDANGNLTKQYLLAGTGYNGTEALITKTIYADLGEVNTKYDLRGNARIITDQLGRVTTQSFDRLGRTTQVNHAGGLVDNYQYDALGQQIKHHNNLLGSGNAELSKFDQQGRVVSQRAFGGDVTSTSYAWNAGLVTNGLGTFGGWTQTTSYINGKSSTVTTDVFGRELTKNDLGNNLTTHTYDKAGRLTYTAGRTSGSTTDNWYTDHSFLNTGKLAQSIQSDGPTNSTFYAWSTRTATYGYDKAGNLTKEKLVDIGRRKTFKTGSYNYLASYSRTLTNATSTYDALGRLTSWTEAGNSVIPYSAKSIQYDANGNIRKTVNTFYKIDNNGNFGPGHSDGTAHDYSLQTKDFWYAYDTMNRVVTNKGTFNGTYIERGASGDTIGYDAAGQRQFSIRDAVVGYVDKITGTTYTREDYDYSDAGHLLETQINSVVRAEFTYDLMGRTKTQKEFQAGGTTVAFNRIVTYNTSGQISAETTFTRKGSDWLEQRNRYYFRGETSPITNDGTNAKYALGAATLVWTDDFKNNSYEDTSSTRNYYVWRDSAVQNSIQYQPTISSSTTNTTQFFYNERGQLNSTWIADGRSRLVSFWNDSNGQVIDRDEDDVRHTKGDPRELRYRFGGKEMGYTGNNGTLDTNYEKSISNRTTEPYKPTDWAFRNGERYGVQHDAFDPSIDHINSYSQGSDSGVYTVRSGDTLKGIAATIYGDSSLWYKIAQVNSVSANSSLIEGQTLILPSGVVRSTHNATTFQPYDPGEAIGEISPTIPTDKSNKCGIFGQILLAVIAVAVTAIAGPVGTFISNALAGTIGATAAGVAGGAAVGAISSTVSQTVGVATGIQDKFSFKSVALAAIGAGIGGGLKANASFGKVLGKVGGHGATAGKALGVGSKFGADFAQGAVQGLTGSVLGQGVGLATGLQSKFDWAGLAAAGVSGGIASGLGGILNVESFTTASSRSIGNIAKQTLVASASAIAGAATRSAISGSNFGDNVVASIPDVIGQVLGGVIGACFTGETLVHTPNGMKRIDEIKVGDWVYSRDEHFNNDNVVPRQVIELYRFEDRATLDVTISFKDGKETILRTTPEHPFAVVEERELETVANHLAQPIAVNGDRNAEVETVLSWRSAHGLEIGTRVIDIQGKEALVTALEPVGTLSTVHNFAVEDHHTYYVGDQGVWVHNRYLDANEAAAEIMANNTKRVLKDYPLRSTDSPEITYSDVTDLDGVAAHLYKLNGWDSSFAADVYKSLLSTAGDSNSLKQAVSAAFIEGALGDEVVSQNWNGDIVSTEVAASEFLNISSSTDSAKIFADEIRALAGVYGEDGANPALAVGVMSIADEALGAEFLGEVNRHLAQVDIGFGENWEVSFRNPGQLKSAAGKVIRNVIVGMTSGEYMVETGDYSLYSTFNAAEAGWTSMAWASVDAISLASGTLGGVKAIASKVALASRKGASLTINAPKILSKTNDVRIHRDFGGKIKALQSAARRGELKYTPDTDSIRVSSLQNSYRNRVAARYKSRFGVNPSFKGLDADHPVDLVVGGKVDQVLKLRNRSINRSIGSSLRLAAERAGLNPGDPISSIIVRGY